jgi:hypothetical protein
VSALHSGDLQSTSVIAAKSQAPEEAPGLLGLLVRCMLSAMLAELLKLQPLRYGLLVLCGRVVPALTLGAGKRDYIPHNTIYSEALSAPPLVHFERREHLKYLKIDGAR